MQTLAIVPGSDVRCPKCNKKLLETRSKTRATDLPVFCDRCKVLRVVNILPLEPMRP